MDLRSLGVDLGLRNGAIVLVTLQEELPIVRSLSVLSVWEREQYPWNPPELAAFLQRILRWISPQTLSGLPVGIDWDFHEVYWGGRFQAVAKAFATGYLYRRLLEYGSLPLIISPRGIREALRLPGTCPKQEVWETVKPYFSPEINWENCNGDVRDAAILALVASHLLSHRSRVEG